MKIITICAGKGGVGKTYTTLSIAVELSIKLKKKKILVVDLDPSVNTSIRICSEEETPHTLADLFEDVNFDPRKAIYPTSENFPNVDIMVSSDKLDFIDRLVAKRKNPDQILKRNLKKLESDYEVVLIDCPPSRGTLASNALAACDAYLTPFILDDGAIDGVLAINRLLDELLEEEVIDKRPIQLGAFVVAFEKPNSRATKHVMGLATEYLNESLLKVKIPGTTHVKEAVSHQSTLQFDRNHKVCLAYATLTKHIAKKLELRGYSN